MTNQPPPEPDPLSRASRSRVPPPDYADYLGRVQRSQLVPAEQLVRAVDAMDIELGDVPRTAELFACRLLQSNLITPWQHRMLLQGRVKRFFLGHYKLLDQIGSGGMGNVYLAEHTLMRRLVAIKVATGHREEDATRIRRFIVESQATAKLDHPHIVKVFHLDREFELYYLVMEYVAGIDLRKLVEREGRLGYARVARYMMEVADGLAHLHAHGLIHRDIKPANLLVDEKDCIKILDLGLARVTAGDRESLTGDQRIVGTLDFIAPEQIRDSRTVDGRTDLYSLGATMYYLLTGQPPFEGASTVERMHKHLHDQPTPIDVLRPDVPPRLAAICRQLMAKDPLQRFQSAEEARVVLEQWIYGGEDPSGTFSRSILGEGLPAQSAADLVAGGILRAPMQGETNLEYARTAVDLPRLSAIQGEPAVSRREFHESLDRLARGVAHRFNNLLQCMLGELELTSLELDTGSHLNESLARIADAARRATELTKQLLLLGGKVKCLRTTIGLDELVRTQAQLFFAYLPSHIRLRIDISSELASVSVDVTLIHRLLSNLIQNAKEALEPGGGVITLRAGVVGDSTTSLSSEGGVDLRSGRNPNDEAYIEVEDSGRGVTEDVRRRMFEPFFSTRSADRGLGLAVARGIAAQHYGRLEAFSTEGQGLRIRLTLPCENSSSSRRAPSASDVAAQLAPQVLVVDDELSIRELARRTLERFGFVVKVAEHGTEAITLLGQGRVDLVVLDLTLPGMSGEETFARLREIQTDLPVIVSSGTNDSSVLDRLASRGAVEFLQKPYRPTVLVETVRKVLRAREELTG